MSVFVPSPILQAIRAEFAEGRAAAQSLVRSAGRDAAVARFQSEVPPPPCPADFPRLDFWRGWLDGLTE